MLCISSLSSLHTEASRLLSYLNQTCHNDSRSKAWAYSTIALLNTLYSNVRADVDHQPVHEGMPTHQVLIQHVYLQDIGVVNPCLAMQA